MSMDSAHSKPASATPGTWANLPALPRPAYDWPTNYFTAAQMRDYALIARADALEEAANLCGVLDAKADPYFMGDNPPTINGRACAAAIRAAATGAKP